MHSTVAQSIQIKCCASSCLFFSLSLSLLPVFHPFLHRTTVDRVNQSAERGIVDWLCYESRGWYWKCSNRVQRDRGRVRDIYVYKKVEWTIEIDTQDVCVCVCVFIERSKRESKGDVSEGWKMVATGIYTSAYGHEYGREGWLFY